MKKRILITILSVISFIVAGCSNNADHTEKDDSVVVRLIEDNSFRIDSSNPVVIKKGDNATFLVYLNEGFEFDNNSEGVYDHTTNEYTIRNVLVSKNVTFLTKRLNTYSLTINNDETLGDVYVTPLKDNYDPGEEISISVTCKQEQDFMCFTKSYPFKSEDWRPSGRPVSFSPVYTFNIDSNLVLYTNYFTKGLLRIEYFANGGKTIDEADSITLDYRIPKQFTSPTTMLGTHYFIRNGYTLESYNTKADGSGTRVGIGSAVDISEASNNKIELYAQWACWTSSSLFDFSYNEETDSYSINKYLGNDECVVVPEIFNGKIVDTISSHSFDGELLKKLVLNNHIKCIEDEALENCSNLEAIVFYTSITSISAKFFNNCPNFTKFILNNTLYIYESNKRNQDFIGQMQTIESRKEKKIIFYGPSTMRYNQPLDPFYETFENRFIYLSGLQGASNYKLGLDLVLTALSQEDYIFPQLYERSLKLDGGGTDTLTFMNYNFDILQRINIQDYIINIFEIFPLYVSDYQDHQGDGIYLNQAFYAYNEFGSFSWDSETDDVNNKDPSMKYNFKKYQQDENFSYFDYLFLKHSFPSDHVFTCWSSYNVNSVTNLDDFLEYETFAKERLSNYIFFDSITNNIYPGNYFRVNDSEHLSSKGGLARATLWVSELISNGYLLP